MNSVKINLPFKAWNSEVAGQFFDDGFGYILDGTGPENYSTIKTAIEDILGTDKLAAVGRIVGHSLEILYFDN